MGSLYFIIKNTVLTVIIVCFMQIQFGGKSIEHRLMGFVRKTVAPKFLGTETTYIKEKSLAIDHKDLQKIRNNKVFDGVKTKAKDLFFKEMNEVIKESQKEKLKELEKSESKKED